jgi:hypothetical protein
MSEGQPKSRNQAWARAAREYAWFSFLLLLMVLFLGTAPRR